ncbi:hypothetical protein QTO34_017657 [Cnephaeus nilssonii]|uniref:Ig-like domain-containing protein n=1 Tax=Cnephaeus nilssonii TaxID=3371016 RepID=A0AA40I1J0_CNENI|nr:hypothetical protein QTO34_017657 [Eptesicus nilssonii]
MAQTLSSRRHWRRELSVLLAQSATPATLSPAPCASCWPNRGRSGVMSLHGTEGMVMEFLRKTKDLDQFLKSNQLIPFIQRNHQKEKFHSTVGHEPALSQFTSNVLHFFFSKWCSELGIHRWRMNNGDIDLTSDRYSMVGGNLVINNPDKQRDAGVYYCLASNNYGMVRSTEATLSFGYLDPFPPEERPEVRVKEGKGMVLLCDPPYHFPDDLSYRWLLNEFPVFITMDKRRFVSQTNGNLYIANVEASDKGNYSCFVSSPSITKSVFSKFIPLIPLPERTTKPYPADIVVQFKDIYALMGQNVTLECFALGNPVPDIRWRKVLEPMPSTAEISTSGAVLKIFNIQLEDEGTYECEAENIRGRTDTRQEFMFKILPFLLISAFPEWVEHINDTEVDIGSDLYWPCVATGKPIPTIRWLKNGYVV